MKKHVRNHAVYQRWQVVSSSNRFQSEEVLERDRQRQRAAACDLRSRGGRRHNASPARSHAAALFFGGGMPEDPAHLPPGALQHVARPPSRSMDIMPNNAAGPVADMTQGGANTDMEGTSLADSNEGSSATSDDDEGSESEEREEDSDERRRSTKESEEWKPAMPRKHIPHSIGIKRKVEDLPDINTLYEPRELAQLFKCVDSYVHLVLSPGANVAHTPEMFLASMLSSLHPAVREREHHRERDQDRRPITPNTDIGGPGGYLRDREGPLVLRPIFCRFLLGSKLCGSRDSPHRYQDCVAAFDAHASRYEAFSGMPRNLLLRVLSGIVLPPGCEASLMASAFSDKAIRQLPNQVRRFLDTHLRNATSHCEARRQALEDSISRLPWVDTLLWLDPALLPKVEEDADSKEKDQSPKPKEKEKDKEKEPPRSRRGDRPKLERSLTQNLEEPKAKSKAVRMKAPEPTLRFPPGLWPPLPPRYVISERGLQQWKEGIRQWEDEVYQQSPLQLRALYENTAKVVLGELLSSQLLEPEVLHFASRFQPLFTRIFDEYADEHSADLVHHDASASSGSDCGTEASTPTATAAVASMPAMRGSGGMRGKAEEKTPPPSRSSRLTKTLKHREGPADLMSFNAFFYFCTEFELFPKHASFDELKMIYDSAEMIQELSIEPFEVPRRRTTPQASAALASQLPRVDLTFMDKPMLEMNDLELQVTFFFATLEQWMESRFLRLADLVVQRMPWGLEELEESGSMAAVRFPDKHKRRSAIAAPKEEPSLPASPSGNSSDKRVVLRQDTRKEVRSTEEEKKVVKTVTNKGDEKKDAKKEDEKKEKKEKGGTVQLAPWLTLSASDLLEIASPPGQGYLMKVEELQQCFRMLLKSSSPSPEITVYQLDKVLSKAKSLFDQTSMAGCFMLKPDSELSYSERATRQFFDALDRKLMEKLTRVGGHSKLDTCFEGEDTITPAMLIKKAITYALSPDTIPTEKDLATSLPQIGGQRDTGNMTRSVFFRALALARHHRRMQRAKTIKARSALLAQQTRRSTWWPEGSHPAQTSKRAKGAIIAKPKHKAFRVAAFVECLVKLALHRLGSKGQLELQRGAPTWWKCTWLLNLLGMRFTETVRDKEHEDALKELIGKDRPAVKTKDLDFWWYRMHQTDRPRYIPPLERLVRHNPDLFQPWKAEAPLLVPEDRKGVCPECQEHRSPSGWGSPGCLSCSEIESFCLPFESHMFSNLVKNSSMGANSEVSDMSYMSPHSEFIEEGGGFRLPFGAEEISQLSIIT